ncbi:protein regulator of cytokinesis 1-like isoform X1 [Rhopilema esculentum]|uniref:protein regulator of cytokinesis 1-like isoform X1 n=1 Tax=Rhopilema esculentum TaxID=499914 RepID=UPI0031E30ADE
MDDREETLIRDINSEIDVVGKVVEVCKRGKELLEIIWEQLGINGEQRIKRNERFFDLIANLVNDMVTEEQELKKQVEQRVVEFSEKIDNLTEELQLPKFQADPSWSLIIRETELRKEVDVLNKEKHQRMKTLATKRSEELTLCQRLALEQLEMTFVGCPSAQQLNELSQNIKFLQDEMEKRLALLKKHQESIKRLWKELEIDPYSEFEMQLCSDEAEEKFILSKENMNKLKDLEEQLELEHRKLVGEIDGLRGKVKALWDRLEVADEERKKFTEKNNELCPKTANALKNELSRLQELKRQHMQKFVDNLRKELDALWDKCYYSSEQRNEFRPYFEAVFDDESLALHEHQVQIMNNYFNENKKIYKLIEKREVSWQNKMDFENKSANADRLFNARGGALLKEAKMRAAFEKGLPKIEEELKKSLKGWETDNETYFLYNGVRYLDRIESQHAAYEALKEQKKQERNKAKLESTKQEMVFGSKPSTTKRKAVGTPIRTGTPMKSPKRGRMDTTHNNTRFVHSSIMNTPKKTPGSEKKPLTGKQTKSKIMTSARRKSNRMRQQTRARQIAGHNMTYQHPSPSAKLNSSKSSVVSGSIVNKENAQPGNIGSYQEFSIGITSPNCRSSFVATNSSFHV